MKTVKGLKTKEKELIKIGKEKGSITSAELKEVLEDIEINEEVLAHINEVKPNFFFQNYLITSFIGIFVKTHSIILITGLVNLFLMLNIFAADEETYYTFFFWFDIFGVTATSISD